MNCIAIIYRQPYHDLVKETPHICLLDTNTLSTTLISCSEVTVSNSTLRVLNNWPILKYQIIKINPSLEDIAKILSTNQIVRPEYKEKLAKYVISLIGEDNV